MLALLAEMPAAPMASPRRVMELIDEYQLAGSGIGYVDAHLVATAIDLHQGLLTDDQRLSTVARSAGVLVTF